MRRRSVPILPVDGCCEEIEISVDMHNSLALIAGKRVKHLKGQLIFFNRSITQVLEAAYIQGMSDMAEAVSRNSH